MHFLQSNFNGGIFTPLMIGRPDVASYNTGCLQLENFVVRPYGGAFKAPGTQFVGEVKNSALRTRLISWRISRAENYVLELGNGYLRIWRSDPGFGNLEYLKTPTLAATPVYSTLEAWPVGYIVNYSSVIYVRTSGNASSIGPFVPSEWSALGASSPFEYPTPWTTGALADIQIQQINRDLVFVHPSYPPYILECPESLSRHYDPSTISDFETSLTWSATSFKDHTWFRFLPLKFSFPPLRDSLAVGNGRTVTLDISLSQWVVSTAISLGDKRKNKGIAYVCTLALTGAQNTTAKEPGVGATWALNWRVATAAEYSMTLTGSDALAFRNIVPGDDIIIEPPVSGRAQTLALSASSALGPTSATFIQGAFVVRSEWAQGSSPLGTVTLEVSYDNTRWEWANEWNTTTPSAGTIAFSGEAPTEGAWYRLRANITSGGGTVRTVLIEPVGAMMKLSFRVRSITSATVLVVDSGLPFGGTPPPEAMGVSATSWYLSAFCSQNGYPSAVAFHNLRLWLGGTLQEPNRLRGSAVNDFLNFATGSEDDDGFDITLAATDAANVRWISSYRQGLVVGTGGEEWTIQGGDGTEVLKPTNVQAIRRSRSGSKALAPIQTRDALLWVSATGRKLFEFAYVFTSDKYEAPDMTLRAEHITNGGIQEMSFASEPDPVLWCVTGDGDLIGFSYNRQNEITAWFERTTDGTFESVVTIADNNGADQVWCVVKRTINGATKRYIERFYPTAQEFDFSTSSNLWYVDSGKKVSPSGTSITGLSHLEGKIVKVWADGARVETKTVSGGAITLSQAATTAIVGLPINSTVQTMPLEVQLQDGTAQGRNWRPNRVVFLLQDSLGGQYADTPEGTFFNLEYPAGQSGLFAGRIKQHIAANWEDTVQFTVQHNDPTPFNLLGYVLIAEVDGS